MVAEIGQDNNGMYWGEIKDKDDKTTVASTTAKTAFEIHQWAYEHGCTMLILKN